MAHEQNIGDVERWSMVVVYNRKTGKIMHTHECLTLRGGQHPSQKAIEGETLEHALLAGIKAADVSLLPVDPQHVKAGSHYKVDTKTQALVEIAQPTRRKPKGG